MLSVIASRERNKTDGSARGKGRKRGFFSLPFVPSEFCIMLMHNTQTLNDNVHTVKIKFCSKRKTKGYYGKWSCFTLIGRTLFKIEKTRGRSAKVQGRQKYTSLRR